MSDITLADQIKSVEREIAMRRSVYPRFISKGRMTEAKAGHELAAMQAVMETLLAIQEAAPAPREK